MNKRDTTIFIEPMSQMPGIRSLHNTDVDFEPHTGQQVLDQESLVVMGNWTDYTGSGTQPKMSVPMQGVVNQLQGTVANILDGARFSDVNSFGKRIATNRTRQKIVNMEFEQLNPTK